MNNLGYNNNNYLEGDVVISGDLDVEENAIIQGNLTVEGSISGVTGSTGSFNIIKTNSVIGLNHPINSLDLSQPSQIVMKWQGLSGANTLVGDDYFLTLSGNSDPVIVTYGVTTKFITGNTGVFIATDDNTARIVLEDSKVRINSLTYPSADGSDGQVLTTDGAGNINFESLPAISNVTQNEYIFQMSQTDPYAQFANLLPFLGSFVYDSATNSSIPQNVSTSFIYNFPNYAPPDDSDNYLLFYPETYTNYFCYKDNTGTAGYTSPIATSQTSVNNTYYQKLIIPINGASITRAYQSIIVDIAWKGFINNNSIKIYVYYGTSPPTANVNQPLSATELGAIVLEDFTTSSNYEYKYFVRNQYNLQPSAFNGASAFVVIEQKYDSGSTLNAQGVDGLCIARFDVIGTYVSSGGYAPVPVTSINHGDLLGLTDDNHPQYALLDGRPSDVLKIDTIENYSGAGLNINGLTGINGQPLSALIGVTGPTGPAGVVASGGVIVLGNGSTGALSLGFTGSTGTGLYRSAADTLSVTTNYVNRLNVSTTAMTATLPFTNSGQHTTARSSSGNTQNINNNAWVVLTLWNTQDFNKGSITYNSGYFTVPVAGIYLICATVSLPNSVDGTTAAVRITANGVANVATQSSLLTSTDLTRLNVSYIGSLAASQQYSVELAQLSGGTITIGGAENRVQVTLLN